MKNYILFFIFSCFVFYSCKNKTHEPVTTVTEGTKIELKYAKGFSIIKYPSHTMLEIHNPWPNAESEFIYYLSNSLPEDIIYKFPKEKIIQTPIKKIVVTSTTHIPALELLGVEQTLVGFPGTNYVSSAKTRKRIDEGLVKEIGKNESINTEVLLELQPDLVVGFGVDGVNKTFETLKKSGIKVVYNGDWVESSPLAKAEWIKFFGALYNKEKEADSIFNSIEKSYLEAKKLAKSVAKQPTILSGAMHKDVWYLPSGTSPEAEFLKDANVNYLWKNTSGKGSLALSFETVFDKAQDADIWLSPSYYTSLDALEKANTHYTKFSAFQNNSVFSFSNTTGETGGVLYYELGYARPDLVLKDIIKVCHPELLTDYEPTFFKQLQ